MSEFYIYHPVMGGKRYTYRRGTCKKCWGKEQRERRKTLKYKIQCSRWQRKYFLKVKDKKWFKEKQKEINKLARIKYPKKNRTRGMLRDYVRRGKMIRLPCEVCGDVKTHGHHDDYDKPLEVRWLCVFHHRETHGLNTYTKMSC